MLGTAASHQTNRLAIHATKEVIWHVTVQTLRAVVVAIVNVANVVVSVVANAVAMIETCPVTLVTRAVTFRATVQMAPSNFSITFLQLSFIIDYFRLFASIEQVMLQLWQQGTSQS